MNLLSCTSAVTAAPRTCVTLKLSRRDLCGSQIFQGRPGLCAQRKHEVDLFFYFRNRPRWCTALRVLSVRYVHGKRTQIRDIHMAYMKESRVPGEVSVFLCFVLGGKKKVVSVGNKSVSSSSFIFFFLFSSAKKEGRLVRSAPCLRHSGKSLIFLLVVVAVVAVVVIVCFTVVLWP